MKKKILCKDCERKEKKTKIEIFYEFLGMDCLMFYTGKYIMRLVLGSMAIHYLINLFLKLPENVKDSEVFVLAFMFGIVSIPLYISWVILEDLFFSEEENN